MKNQIIALSVILNITILMSSCGSKNNIQQVEPSSTEQKSVDTIGSSKSIATHYQCPMKCEGEKMYDKPGSCPVCKMDLKEVKENHEHHQHDTTHLNH